jgi:mutator protein MutT
MIYTCEYCSMDSAGNHDWNCSMNPRNTPVVTISAPSTPHYIRVDCLDCQSKQSLIEQQREEIRKLTPILVVAAVMKDYLGEYLIAKRKPEQWMGGKWCFAGGKVELGEELDEALVREIMEELGVHIIVNKLLHTQLQQYEHGCFLLHYFDCTITAGEIPRALDCSDYVWVTADKLQTIDLLPVDIDIAKRIGFEAELFRLYGLLEEIENRGEKYIADTEMLDSQLKEGVIFAFQVVAAIAKRRHQK